MKKALLLIAVFILASCSTLKQPQTLNFKIEEKESMPYAAFDFGAELYNGKIYAFLDNPNKEYKKKKAENNYGDVCTYDIATDKWSKTNTIPNTIKGATSTIIDAKIYLVGAYKGDAIQVYNIETNSWEENIKMPRPFHFTTVESYKNKLYLICGYKHGKRKKDEAITLQNVFIYNTKTKKWSEGIPYPRKASGLNSLKYKNEFYVWSLKEAYKYSPKKGTWSEYAPLKDKMKYSQEGVVLNKQFYFVNGRSSNFPKATSAKKIARYDVKEKVFEELKSELNHSRKRQFNVFAYKGEIYILGGRNAETTNAIDNLVKVTLNTSN